MKSLSLPLLLILGLLGACQKEQSHSTTSPNQSHIIHLKVQGMTCTGCEDHIKETLAKVPNIDQIQAHHENGQVEVRFHGEAQKTLLEVQLLLNQIEYPVQESKID